MTHETKLEVVTHIQSDGKWTIMSVIVGSHTIWTRTIWLINFSDRDAFDRKVKRLTVAMDEVADRYSEQVPSV